MIGTVNVPWSCFSLACDERWRQKAAGCGISGFPWGSYRGAMQQSSRPFVILFTLGFAWCYCCLVLAASSWTFQEVPSWLDWKLAGNLGRTWRSLWVVGLALRYQHSLVDPSSCQHLRQTLFRSLCAGLSWPGCLSCTFYAIGFSGIDLHCTKRKSIQ